jgi:hypothetical protein
MEELRKTEIFTENGWVEIPFMELTAGDVFRLFEPTGEIVVDSYGVNEFLAVSNATIDPIHNVGTIQIDGEDVDLELEKV